MECGYYVMTYMKAILMECGTIIHYCILKEITLTLKQILMTLEINWQIILLNVTTGSYIVSPFVNFVGLNSNIFYLYKGCLCYGHGLCLGEMKTIVRTFVEKTMYFA